MKKSPLTPLTTFALIGIAAMSAGTTLGDSPEPSLDAQTAGRLARLALDCVHREYPNKIAHVLNGDDDALPPRQLTPAFYGCYDWHSSVHGHWLLTRLTKLYPDAPFAVRARAALDTSFAADKLAAEEVYLDRTGRESFERPYGLAWLLCLAEELRTWDDEQARALLADAVRLTPLRHWRAEDGSRYPVAWRLQVAEEGLDLEVRALLDDPVLARGEVTTRYLNDFAWRPARIDVLQGGTQTSIQEWPGRRGFWHVGIPPSGPFDGYSFRLGNRLLGNPDGLAGLEITLQGPTLKFSAATEIVIAGAEIDACFVVDIDGCPVEQHEGRPSRLDPPQ